MSILKIAEKDIENGNVKDSEEVFNELRKKITKNGT
jgi:predicted transcriptional regulator